MITEENLEALGFENIKSPFSSKMEWVIGKEDDRYGICKNLPIVYYDIEMQYANYIHGEFSRVGRRCETEEEIIKYVDCLKFLFKFSDDKLSLNIKK